MTGPLTYPPEIVIESKIDLPYDFWQEEIGRLGRKGTSVEVRYEWARMMIEIVAERLRRL